MGDRYAVIGNPIAHSKSPWIHARFAAATGQDLEYRSIEAPLEGFSQAVERWRAGGGMGLNVTVPFKQQAFRLCARVTERARVAQAVNTLDLEKNFGDNTDGVGLVRDLTANLGVSLGGKNVLLMGAGGAAQAVVGALLDAGIARLAIGNRTAARARALAARFEGVTAGGYEALGREPFDLVVNATSAGLQGEGPQLPHSVFGPRTVAYDMVYGRETSFMAAARVAGARVFDGLGMLVEQAAESFLVWRGVRPDTGAVLKELRGLR